jgi:ketosteroid isomerase-like protein
MGANMKLDIKIISFLVFSFIAFVSCQVLASTNSGIQAEIENAVKEATKAWEDFPRTLDSNAYLKFFASDYSGVNDGKSQTIKDLERDLEELKERIKLGEPIGFSNKITDMEIQPLTDRVAWLTYQVETKVGRGGMVIEEIQSKCSTLVRKKEETWLVFHEHCSRVNGFPLPKGKKWLY